MIAVGDPLVFRATMAGQVAGHRLLIGDTAYRSAPEVITRRNKIKPFVERRARAEHAIVGLKGFKVLRQHHTIGRTDRRTAEAKYAKHGNGSRIMCAGSRTMRSATQRENAETPLNCSRSPVT
ncbi:hypothetical protein ABZ865_18950 [Streptomyces sp. NPDC047085]|uniref:hypothetical protein n=1 Tax=Streptomyces sp. NPDC047085 TaxID=3155140 RepID=UPI0033EAB812